MLYVDQFSSKEMNLGMASTSKYKKNVKCVRCIDYYAYAT